MPAIQHEFFGAQPQAVCFLVNRSGIVHQFPPIIGRMNVHLNHAGIGSHFDVLDARVVRRRVPFNHYRHIELRRRVFERGQQFHVILGPIHRRHENVQTSVAGFDAQPPPHDPGRRFAHLRLAVALGSLAR